MAFRIVLALAALATAVIAVPSRKVTCSPGRVVNDATVSLWSMSILFRTDPSPVTVLPVV